MILLAQVFACFFMTGLIWTIQVLHYPTFAMVGASGFTAFHQFHSRRITWIVLPVMSIELMTAGWLAYVDPSVIFISNCAGVIAIWAATAFLSVPAHERLGRGFDPAIARKLVVTNWVCTFLWSARSALLVVWLYGVL